MPLRHPVARSDGRQVDGRVRGGGRGLEVLQPLGSRMRRFDHLDVGGVAVAARLSQQPREPAVLEHAPLGLAGRAVGDHVVLEVDRTQRRAAARARLALVAVDLQRHRQLVGDRQADRAARSARARRRASRRSPSRSARASSSSRSAPRLYGDSRACHRISSTHERPIPAITRWSRSSACSGRGASSSAFSGGGSGQASGPRRGQRVLVLQPVGRAAASPRRPAWSRTRAAAAPRAGIPGAGSMRTSSREVRSRGPARLSYSCSRPADIRWISSASPPPASTIRCLPRRRTALDPSAPPAPRAAASKVFSALMPGASADSIRAPPSASSSRRAVISTSGSSGMGSHRRGADCQLARDRAGLRRRGPSGSSSAPASRPR